MMMLRLCLVVGLLVLYGCDASTSPRNNQIRNESDSIGIISVIRQALVNVQDGDLVVRCGRDFTSTSLSKLNRRNKLYSHCGIVRIEQNQPYVYHAMGGEFNPDQALMREPFVDFVNPKHEIRFAMFRLDSTQVNLETMYNQMKKDYQHKLPFDLAFDLNTSDRMYCSEWAAHCISKALSKSKPFNISQIGTKAFIGVDDLFLHPAFREILAVSYK